jgi:signal transduction histidine kinase
MLADDLTGREAEFAETVVEQSDEVASLVDRFRVMLDALTGDGDDDLGPRALVPAVEDRVRTLRTVHPEADVRFDPPDAGGDGGGAGGGEEVTVTAGEALPNVLGNVLSNAVEHNDRPEPTVDVSVEVSSGSAVVRVADDGPGVPDGKKDAVFRRGERGLKEEDVGSGFGLFFVETMVDRYGGSVRVRDNDPRGAVFELEFQLA